MSAGAVQPAAMLPEEAARRFEAIVFAEHRPAGQVEAKRLADLGTEAEAATIELVLEPDTSPGKLDARVADLWRLGIGSAEVLCVGPEPDTIPTGAVWISGDLDVLDAVLEDQIARRCAGELPLTGRDPAWTLAVTDDKTEREALPEGLLTLADGTLGMRGSVLNADAESNPSVVMAGVYTGEGPETQLLGGPSWNTLVLGTGSGSGSGSGSGLGSGTEAGLYGERVLNLRAGTLAHELKGTAACVRALMLSSLARPATTLLRASGSGVELPVGDPLRPPAGADHRQGADGDQTWMRVTGSLSSIVAARHTRVAVSPGDGEMTHWLLDRTTAYEGDPKGASDERSALAAVTDAKKLGFDALFAEHRRAWAARWEDADIAIAGDTGLQSRLRLALFHLISSAADHGEAAVGARGLTGSGYRGHVFWDTDVYVLPFLAATHPASARAALEYRYRRLPASLAAARALGRSGARFAWESAVSGEDITPASAPDGKGGMGVVYSGVQEEHVVADVAWAAANYIDWTGDETFAAGPGLELLVQTARWWASRIQRDEDGSAHIRNVMGPDEYHESVDDDAYTNVMARWNLRRAADASAGTRAIEQRERDRWLRLADTITDGYDPATGIYEQFAGWNGLEPMVIADLEPQRPVAADVLLGRARVRGAQIVKQPDVLMLHYLIPEELAPGSLDPNLAYYDPRTAHGSSLSLGVHAALMARAGHLERAVELLDMTTRIDLDDIGGEAAQGVHLAAMGSVWRGIAFGFIGLRPVGDALAIDPVLPPAWESLKLAVIFHGSRIRLCVRNDSVELSASEPVAVLTPAGERVRLGRKPQTFLTGSRIP